jgi:hypothetical protein
VETVASGSSASTFIPTTRIFPPIVDAHPHVSRPRTRPDVDSSILIGRRGHAGGGSLRGSARRQRGRGRGSDRSGRVLGRDTCLLPIRIEESTASPHRPLPMALSPNPLGRPQISTETSQSDKRDPADTARSGQDGITSDIQGLLQVSFCSQHHFCHPVAFLSFVGQVSFWDTEKYLSSGRSLRVRRDSILSASGMTKMMLRAEADLQKALKAWTSAYGSIEKSRSHTAIHLLSLVRDESSSHICPQSLSCEACAVTQPSIEP